MRSAPLGFFNSGVGGLTVVRAAQQLLPHEDIIYLGDTARVPYGSKSPQTIREFAAQDVEFLLSHGVKAIVIACNTATAHALPTLQENFKIPIIGVGGVDSGEAAYARIRAGASLLQLYTALVYKGPGLVCDIQDELRDLLAKDGFKDVSEAVGVDASKIAPGVTEL